MKILVVGSGGREHAMVWKLAQSKRVEKIYAAPGNGGTAGEEKTSNVPLNGADPASEEGQKLLLEFALKEKPDFTLVGPEAPLDAGLADRFRAAGLAIVGPGKDAARLETSKVYSKAFMEKYGVRSPERKIFADPEKACEYTEKCFGKGGGKGPLVIKASGLAAGKGVVVTADIVEAKETLRAFMKQGILGDAGKSVVFEEYLEGVEVSILAAVSAVPGKNGVIKPFIPARDHKRRFEGGRGPNTGGMGAIAPVPEFTPALQKDFEDAIAAPTLKGMAAENMDYRGFIFFGLMVSGGRCRLLEYNARLGDPETQAALPLMDSDFAELCASILDGTLRDFPLRWKKGAVCAPVAVSGGYPGAYRSGLPIAIDSAGFGRTGAKLFAAGAVDASAVEAGAGGLSVPGLRTAGGRVLAVSAFGSDADDARTRAYEALSFVDFEGMAYRKDIGREQEFAAAEKAGGAASGGGERAETAHG